MEKESLLAAQEIITKSITDSSIEIFDKVELILNINKFLDENSYNDNIQTLKQKQLKK